MPGDKVAIDLENCPEYLETFYASLLLGCAPVNVNFRYTADEVHYVVDNSDARAIIHSPHVAGSVTRAVAHIPAPRRPLLLEVGARLRTRDRRLATARHLDAAAQR